MPEIDLQQQMIDRDKSSWEQALKEGAAQRGVSYDPSDLEGVIRHASYGANAGQDPAKFLNEAFATYDKRAAPTSARQYDSQGPAYNQTTNQLNPGYNPAGGTLIPPPPPNPNDPRVATTTPYNPNTSPQPGFQFNDPYTKLYEDVARKNLESLQGNNAQMQQLMSFLNTQFTNLNQPSPAEQQASRYLESLQQTNPQVQQMMDYLNKQFQALSTAPGYTPDELAVLNTQMFEPIEANRQATQQRVLQRASARGVLPSSGIVQGEQQQTDVDYDRLRAAGNRDVAINALNRRQADQQQALNVGQMGIAIPQAQQQQALAIAQALTQGRQSRVNDALNVANLGVSIPDQRNAQALGVANDLYQIPRTAMNDANAVINGSSPTAALSPLIQLLQTQQQNSQFNQQQNQQQQAALYTALGQIFPEIIKLFPK